MFVERRFFDDVRPEASGGPEYRTTIKTLRGGGEHRNALWADPLRTFTAALGARNTVGIADLLDFAADTRGAADGFRLRDWSDYSATAQNIGTGDGVAYYFRLTKRYGASYLRRIMKPVSGTVTVTVNGVTTAHYLDTVNGIVVFKNPPAVGATIIASFQFDVPVRFASDMTNVVMLYHASGVAPDMAFKEIRIREEIDLALYTAQRALL